jgi:hypothetical protein
MAWNAARRIKGQRSEMTLEQLERSLDREAMASCVVRCLYPYAHPEEACEDCFQRMYIGCASGYQKKTGGLNLRQAEHIKIMKSDKNKKRNAYHYVRSREPNQEHGWGTLLKVDIDLKKVTDDELLEANPLLRCGGGLLLLDGGGLGWGQRCRKIDGCKGGTLHLLIRRDLEGSLCAQPVERPCSKGRTEVPWRTRGGRCHTERTTDGILQGVETAKATRQDDP